MIIIIAISTNPLILNLQASGLELRGEKIIIIIIIIIIITIIFFIPSVLIIPRVKNIKLKTDWNGYSS